MSVKTILYTTNARKVLKNGIETLAKAISLTLGPKGKNIILCKKLGVPEVINDGVTIAKEINLKDHLENYGACLLRQASSKTNTVSGDGTSTSTLLAYSLIEEGMRSVATGANPIILKRGIEKATQFVVNKIIEYARPVENLDDIRKVASISAGNDAAVGDLIATAIDLVGREGLISIEEGKSTHIELRLSEGMSFDRGFVSGYFVTDQKRMEVVLNNAIILITDKKIVRVKQDLLPTLELIEKTNRPLLIISDNVGKEALATLIINKIRRNLNIVAVHAPGFGDRRKALLSDIAVLTGGRVVSGDIGLTLENVELEMLGEARRVIVGKESTTIISDTNKEAVLSRYEQLRRQLETMDSAYEKEKLKERLSKLSGGVAIISVGAPTETEMKDRKLRLEDAVNSTKAALEEGLVPGGGATLAHISDELSEWAKDTLLEDELIGAVLVEKALSAPLKKIASNAGQSGTVIFERVKAAKFEFGYNAGNKSKQRSESMSFPFSLEAKEKTIQSKEDIKYDISHSKPYYKKEASNLGPILSNPNYQSNEIEDMFKIGVIDPAKVTRSALQNAASIASMILTTECIIVDKKH